MGEPKKSKFSFKRQLVAKRIFWGQLRRKDRNAGESDRVKFLKKIPLFKGLSNTQLLDLVNVFHERHYSADEYVFEINQPGAALFVIHTGSVAVEIPGHHEELPTQVALLKKESFLGELALLDGSPRSASARAVEPTVALALSREDLNKLLQTNPDIASHIYRSLAAIIGSRLKATNELLEKEQEEIDKGAAA